MLPMRTGFRRARSALLLAVLMLLLVAVAPGRVAAQVENVVINEIQVSTASVDWEFIELTGAPETDLSSLTLLVIESDAGTSMGAIDRLVSLAGQSIPDDGYWVGASPAGAAAYGITPDLSFANDTFENSTTSYLLVTDFTGALNDDLDTDNDGVLDTTPWTAVVDSITITDGGAGDAAYGAVTFGPDGTFLPSGTFRCPNGPGGTFDGNLLNFDVPDGTPGAANVCDDEPPTDAVAFLSEIRIDQTSDDNDEYFELTGEPGTMLDGLTYLVIGDGTGGSGVIEAVANLSGQVIPASGFFVAAESTFTLGAVDFVTDLNFENNDNVTHLLVRDFTGANGNDLDTNDDGTLDTTPWSEVVECVALLTAAASELTYCDTTVGPDGSNVPGHVFKCEDGWRIGAFDPAGGNDTPGAANACDVTPPPAAASLSEIRIDQPSTDDDEYFELTGEPGAALDGLTYLVIGDGTGGSGVIEEVTDLSGQVIPASGFFVAAETTFTFGTADFVTDLNFENGDNVTHLLVRDFSGSDGADLDTNDDGTLDVTPWSEVVECVALLTGGASELTYCNTTVGPDGAFVPGHVFKCEDGWRIGNFDGGDDTPNAANACDVTPPDELVCGDPATLIHEIQGSGDASPLAGQQHVIEGIVVGDFQGGDGDPFNTDLEGFYVQEEVGEQDAEPATSEGIFVHAPAAADVVPGDVVRVAGTVQEFFGLTELTNVTGLVDCGDAPPPDPVDVTNVDVDEFERYEGMLVRFPQELFISEYFDYDRFGEIKLCTERLFQPTAVHEPGSPEAVALAEHNADVCITLDDARSEQNPDPAYHPNGAEFTLDNLFRGGDIVQNAVGVLDFRFDLYRLQPTQGADFIVANPRPAAPDDVGGRLQVAAFNVLNYFITLDSRGANDPAEFQRQQDKIVAAITAMDAEVVGVMEIENQVPALANLVDALNAAAGAGTYAFIDTGGPVGTDEITVGIMYQPGAVTPVGEEAILDDPSFTDPLGSGQQKSRPAIAQTFMENATGELFTVVVNHLKSKGSVCPGDADPMQGNCNITRTLGAEALVDWLATDPTGSGDPDFLIIGDLNAYDKEDPIDAVREGPDDTLGTGDDYVDLLFQFQGEFAYTYVFDGQLGYLDHALANMSLLPQVTGATAWHINTDEPDLIDYDMTFKQDAQDALYAPDQYRASDHDPVIVGLDLTAPNQPPVCTAAVPSVSVLWPANHQFVPVEILGVTDPEGDAITITIDSVFSDEAVLAPGSGNFAPDAQGIGTSVVELRAERIGGGNGRVYHVNFTATDASGASCSGTVLVSVPVNQGPNGAAVDDGPLHDAALPE